MNINKCLFIVFSILIMFSSCANKVNMNFEITNNTAQEIDYLSVEPNNNIENKFIKIGSQQTVSYVTDISHIKSDGHYTLIYKRNNQIKKKEFGYFTNGIPLEKLIQINIKNDTVLFDIDTKKY